MKFNGPTTLAVAFTVAALSGLAPRAGYAEEEGPTLAHRYCVKCHEIAPGVKPETPLNPAAPSFVTIAKDPQKFPESKIAAVLTNPHAKMEPFAFTADERQSLIAYIKGLAK
jgi:mono/diheme cytochrome c family protein